MSTMNRHTRNVNPSALVAMWQPSRYYDESISVEHEAEAFTLHFPEAAFRIAVTFTRIAGRADLMRVRATNWRAEDEPNGIVSMQDARRFWKLLSANGFIRESNLCSLHTAPVVAAASPVASPVAVSPRRKKPYRTRA